MAEANLPAAGAGAIPLEPAPSFAAGDWRERARAFMAQPAFQRALAALVGLIAVVVAGALYFAIAQGPQRILYSDLSDVERAKVVQALETGGIGYAIDNSTGAITVAETDLYRARMLVASDTGLAAPEGASAMLDAIPLGSSRTLEGERLRLARERELMLTIREIDGIESVRVHLATPERSAFVRENNPPSASVMVRLVSGRSLGRSQVEAIVNLVSGSVPGLTPDKVRVVDQNGRLLSAAREEALGGLVLQREFEAKLREQLGTLLAPLLGEGNFSSQVQVELEQEESTSARESYDREGVIRSESERSATRMAGGAVGGIPGVAANTPPPDAQLVDGPPEATAVDGEQAADRDQEVSTQRNYELGREVAVTSTRPGGLVKLSVAVAVSDAALAAAAPMTAEQLQSLISAAVGADEGRGDTVEVVVSAFENAQTQPLAFYEQKWFADVLRYATALIAVLLVLLLGVRPLVKRLREPSAAAAELASDEGEGDETAYDQQQIAEEPVSDAFPQKVELARQLAASQPDRAVEALQRMLDVSAETKAKASAS
ncbi:flagellar M-Ring protein [Erythrobacter sp. NAP1]|uniref:flagellar basal-body MS-ring/collar protein FliF n=1 Tax=Erythrobacter sp. NAP1 TaxID=237727 RepID=UPI0000687743|nr:flagellar basal-body MS-ring/collar protein FliF [Erythrobacter sp. NAP1]EAQ28893.1 flagellar M-Ring protein [Erythrobacter sp. NAP1]